MSNMWYLDNPVDINDINVYRNQWLQEVIVGNGTGGYISSYNNGVQRHCCLTSSGLVEVIGAIQFTGNEIFINNDNEIIFRLHQN